MADLNMDHKKYPNATAPVLEFSIPRTELDGDFEVGQIGAISVPVEVTHVTDTSISFRKRGAVDQTQFQQASLQDMENHIGVAER